MGTSKYYVPLKGFTTVHQHTTSNDIQDNLVEFFDWSLLEKNNYFNSTLGELSPDSQDYSKLRLSKNENFTAGQVWEGHRENWVWQSGISGVDGYHNPLVGSNHTKPGISGVYVDDTFYPSTTTGDYAHHVDYFNGRIVFDSPIPTGSKVQAEHSYKYINVIYANNLPWVKEIQTKSLSLAAGFFTNEKGDVNVPQEAKVQLPMIAVEVVPNRTFQGYQLGGGQWIRQDVIFHCIAEDEYTRNKLIDIVSLQNDKTICLFDSNRINSATKFPIDYRGMPVSGALRYPDLVEQFYGGKMRLTKASVQQMEMVDSNIFGGVVRMTTELIKSNI
tara:strand:+ start:898 stop:1890 length:993 start_codon:yes stop_codon:yes gene_type:complete